MWLLSPPLIPPKCPEICCFMARRHSDRRTICTHCAVCSIGSTLGARTCKESIRCSQGCLENSPSRPQCLVSDLKCLSWRIMCTIIKYFHKKLFFYFTVTPSFPLPLSILGALLWLAALWSTGSTLRKLACWMKAWRFTVGKMWS